MDLLEKLTELFTRFPGIGKRQAERFVYFLLRQKPSFVKELVTTLGDLHKSSSECSDCKRFFVNKDKKKCSICADPNRDQSLLLIVAQDVDLENIQQGGNYKGRYFVLGGSVPVLEKDPANKIRLDALKKHLETLKPKEIILGLSTNPEGENTLSFLASELKSLQKKLGFTLTTLGRGLSTGAELEYSDPETIKNALANRQ